MIKVPQQPKWALRGCIARAAEVKSCPLVTRVDFGSVKHRIAVSNIDEVRAVLYRSKIDHDDAEISLLYHFGAVGRSRHPPIWSVGKVVPRGEILINPSDPKHVA